LRVRTTTSMARRTPRDKRRLIDSAAISRREEKREKKGERKRKGGGCTVSLRLPMAPVRSGPAPESSEISTVMKNRLKERRKGKEEKGERKERGRRRNDLICTLLRDYPVAAWYHRHVAIVCRQEFTRVRRKNERKEKRKERVILVFEACGTSGILVTGTPGDLVAGCRNSATVHEGTA